MHIVDKATELTQAFAENPTETSYRDIEKFFGGECLNFVLDSQDKTAENYLVMLRCYVLVIKNMGRGDIFLTPALRNLNSRLDMLAGALCIS